MKAYKNSLIIAVLVAVLALGAFAVTKISPDNDTQTGQETADNNEMFNIYQADSEKIVRLNVKNAKEEYYLEKQGDNFYLNGDKTIKLKNTSVKTLLNTCSTVSAKQMISETDENQKGFGLDTNASYVELIFSDNTSQKIIVGNKTMDKENYYIKLDNKPEIYIKNNYGTESIIPLTETLRDLSLISVDPTSYTSIKRVSIKKSGNTPIEILNVADENNKEIPYDFKMTKPVYANISGEIFKDKIMECFSSLSADAVMEDHAKDLSFYSLNNPYGEVSLTVDNVSYNLKLGNETESYRFATLNNSDTVYAIEKSKLTFLDVSYLDVMSTTIHVEYIDKLDKFVILSSGEKYEVKISGEGEKRTYKVNGKNISKDDATHFYRELIGISLESLDFSDAPSKAPDASITYYRKDGTVSKVEFVSVGERAYRVLVDGKGNSITAKKNFENVLSLIRKSYNSKK